MMYFETTRRVFITHNDTTGNDADAVGKGDMRMINELENTRPDEKKRMVTTLDLFSC